MKSQFILPVAPVDNYSHIAESLGIAPDREMELDGLAKQIYEDWARNTTGYIDMFLRLELVAAHYNEMLYLCFMVAGHQGFAAMRVTIGNKTVRQLIEFINPK